MPDRAVTRSEKAGQGHPSHVKDVDEIRQVSGPKLSLVLPAYNESQNIEANLVETCDTLEDLGYNFEVILVDDGSPDETYLHASRAKTLHPDRIRIVRYDRNVGKGNALMCGAKYASGSVVVFMDADMDLHPRQLPTFFSIMGADKASAVIGSKRHPQSNVLYPPIRRLYSTIYYGLVRILFGLPLRDTQTGLKVFTQQMLQDVLPRVVAKRYAFDIELLAVGQSLGYKISEAPVTVNFQRPLGRIKTRDVISMVLDTLAIFYRLRILRYYDRIPTENAGAALIPTDLDDYEHA